MARWQIEPERSFNPTMVRLLPEARREEAILSVRAEGKGEQQLPFRRWSEQTLRGYEE